MEGLRELDGARERELDLLEHELAEIDARAPQEGEQEQLRAERERLRRLDALLAAAGGAAEALAGAQGYDGGADAPDVPGAMALSADAAARLDALAGVDPALDALAERARALAIEAGDLAGELRDYGERLEGEATGAGETGDRRRVGCRRSKSDSRCWSACCASTAPPWPRCWSTPSAHASAASSWWVLRWRWRRSSGRLQAAQATLEERVVELRAAREAAAPRLGEAVREQLAALAMPDAAFAVELSPREVGPAGGDAVELTIAPNPGVARRAAARDRLRG